MSDFVFKILILIYWLASQERFNNKWQQKAGKTIKSFSICPKLLINAVHYGALYWPKGWKKDTVQFGRQILQIYNPLGGPMFEH